MKRRLYFMLPDVATARTMLDELLLARIEERAIRFCAKDDSLPPDLPEASFLQKTDLIHGVEVGMLIGAISGLLAGGTLLIFPPESIELRVMALLLSALGGGIFGSWVSGMAAAAIPNSSLTPFRDGIEHGQVLLIMDLPLHRANDISNMIISRHPEVSFGGMDPHIPVFP